MKLFGNQLDVAPVVGGNLGVATVGGGVVGAGTVPLMPICRKYMMADRHSSTVTTAL